MMSGPRREQLRNNDNEIELQTTTEEPQGCQPEHRRNLQVWQLLFLPTRTLQLLAVRLQAVALRHRCHTVAALVECRGGLNKANFYLV